MLIAKEIKSRISTWSNVKKNQYLILIITLLISLIIRIYLSPSDGHGYDIRTFKTWSQGVYYSGFSHFYNDIPSNYPPLYIYILYLIFKLSLLFSIDINSPIFTMLLKIPAISADVVTALLIFLIVRKYGSFKLAFISMILYAFNPAIIYNSAIWGQVDSIFTLFLMFALMFFVSNKQILSSIFLALAILTKPQSFVLVPLFALAMMKKNSPLNLVKILLVSFATFIIVALPFYINMSIFDLFNFYIMYDNHVPINSQNAFNIWSFQGMFLPDNIEFLFFTYRMWGYIILGLIFMYISYLILKNKDDNLIYIASAVLFFTFFMFLTRMHERYLFPMFAPLAVAVTLDRRFYLVYILSTLTFLFNLLFALENSKTVNAFTRISVLINIILLIYAIYCYSTYKINIKKDI